MKGLNEEKRKRDIKRHMQEAARENRRIKVGVFKKAWRKKV